MYRIYNSRVSITIIHVFCKQNTLHYQFTNAQPVGVEWYLLSYALIACMTFASIIYSYESAKYIFVNNVLNDHRYTILVLKNTGIVIAEIIMIVTPFVVSRI